MLLEKMQVSRSGYARCALLITEFIESIVELTPNILNNNAELYLDIEHM